MNRSHLAMWLGVVLLGASAALAQPRAFAFNGDTTVLTFLPELKDAPAPQWLKPGLRLIWYGEGANVADGPEGALIPNPKGRLRDPKTGEKYSIGRLLGTSGRGYTQLDVVAVHDDVVVVEIVSYGLDGVSDRIHVNFTTAITTPPAYCGDWWVNPDVLARHPEIKGPGYLATRGTYVLNGKAYDCFWLDTKTSNGSTYSFTDNQTGQLLHSGVLNSTPPKTVLINGLLTTFSGRNSFAMSTFRGMRKLEIPWAGAGVPAVLANAHTLTFTGDRTTTVPGSPPLPIRFDGQIAITGHGDDFVQGRRSSAIETVLGRTPEPATDVVSSCNELTPLAIPPEHLARLQVGQVLDRDPITRLVTRVAFVGVDRSGNDRVVLSQSQGQGQFTITYTYDRTTGLLVGMTTTDPTAMTKVDWAITRVQ